MSGSAMDPITGDAWVKIEVVVRADSYRFLLDWIARHEPTHDSRVARAWIESQVGWTAEMICLGTMLDDVANRLGRPA